MELPHPGNHPAGLTGLAASAAVVIAGKVGLHIDVEQAAALIGGAVALVSLVTPRVIDETHVHVIGPTATVADVAKAVNRSGSIAVVDGEPIVAKVDPTPPKPVTPATTVSAPVPPPNAS